MLYKDDTAILRLCSEIYSMTSPHLNLVLEFRQSLNRGNGLCQAEWHDKHKSDD